MFDRSNEGALQRTIFGPARKEFKDPGVVECRLCLLPWAIGNSFHCMRVRGLEDVVEGVVRADLALRPRVRQREVREDKFYRTLLRSPATGIAAGIG